MILIRTCRSGALSPVYQGNRALDERLRPSLVEVDLVEDLQNDGFTGGVDVVAGGPGPDEGVEVGAERGVGELGPQVGFGEFDAGPPMVLVAKIAIAG
jgi:hypothetical protein